jgi:nicotinic acid mononucleotide adenylyltransferase
VGERIVDLRSGRGALDQKGIFFTDVVMNDVSATNIRRLASEGRSDELAQLVPGAVLEYIRKYGIYRELNEAKLNS